MASPMDEITAEGRMKSEIERLRAAIKLIGECAGQWSNDDVLRMRGRLEAIEVKCAIALAPLGTPDPEIVAKMAAELTS